MSRGAGRYKVDRWFDGVRINRTSGATTLAEHRKRDDFLTWLHDTGRLEILRAIAANRLSIPQAYGAHCAGRLTFAANDVVLDRNLWEAVDAWLPGSAKAPGTRNHYDRMMRALKRTGAIGDGLTVRGLELVDWQALQNRWPTGPVMWNRMLGALSRFLTMQTGDKYDPFRRAVMAKVTRADEGEGRVPDLTPERFWAILAHVPEPMRPIYVLMVGTGVEPGVMKSATLAPERQALVVEGAKHGRQGETVIPLSPELWAYARAAVPCSFTPGYLYRRWKKAAVAAGAPALRLYDLRHCFGQWLVNAGVPQSVVQVGMRHKTAAMTARYVKQRDRGVNATVMAGVLFGQSPAESPAPAPGLKLAKGA
jgi:integrase-like protein